MSTFGRRRFLAAAALAAGSAACSDGSGEPGRGGGGSRDVSDTDLDVVEHIAKMELVARDAYREGTAASDAGRLGEMPAAGVEFLRAAAAQHGEAVSALNGLLRRNDRTPVEEGHVEFERVTVGPPLVAMKSWPDAASLARTIEGALAATDLEAIHSTLESDDAIRLVGGLQATCQKRVAVLNFLSGQFPSPDAFQKTDAAVGP